MDDPRLTDSRRMERSLGKLTISDSSIQRSATLNFPSLASAPSSPKRGDVYFNTTSGAMFFFGFGGWEEFGSDVTTGVFDDLTATTSLTSEGITDLVGAVTISGTTIVNSTIAATEFIPSTSSATGTLVVAGGAGIGETLHAGADVVADGDVMASGISFDSGVNVLSTYFRAAEVVDVTGACVDDTANVIMERVGNVVTMSIPTKTLTGNGVASAVSLTGFSAPFLPAVGTKTSYAVTLAPGVAGTTLGLVFVLNTHLSIYQTMGAGPFTVAGPGTITINAQVVTWFV